MASKTTMTDVELYESVLIWWSRHILKMATGNIEVDKESLAAYCALIHVLGKDFLQRSFPGEGEPCLMAFIFAMKTLDVPLDLERRTA